ncbi:glycosyltransferase family 4 protein [Patescibacteria group bacterium]|nr:glycosyltransferase family 4 protein [Patescibacteria group bacterium]MBU1922451.1 glycosyltransferase family 4 protein [Patescibacteria group bacterium]
MTLIAIEAARPNRAQKTGTEWYGFHVIQEMKKIADPKDQFILYTNKPLHSGLEKMPADNWREKRLKWPLSRFWTQGRLSLEMLFKAPDVLYIPAHAMPVIHPKKTVVTLHDVGFERYPELYPKPDLWYHRWSVGYTISQAVKIITVSNFSKDELIKFYQIPPEKIEVTHLGYDAENYKVIDDKVRIDSVLKKYNIKKPYIFYIGRLEPKKNSLLLIEAFGRYKQKHKDDQVSLVLVGRPGFNYIKIRKQVAQCIEKYNLEKWIVRTGWIPEAEVPYIYNGAACFVFPSAYEGFGIPLLEAMACGTPVLSSRAASLPEVGQDAVMYFETHEVESLVQGLKKILHDPALQTALREKGFQRVKNFSWRKTAQQTLDILKSV